MRRDKNNNKPCQVTGKVVFNSEAQATRSVNKYEAIKRVYYCSHCVGFHLTSRSLEETLESGELSVEEENVLLRKRINELIDEIERKIPERKELND